METLRTTTIKPRPLGCGSIRLLQAGICEGRDYPGDRPSLQDPALRVGCAIGHTLARIRPRT